MMQRRFKVRGSELFCVQPCLNIAGAHPGSFGEVVQHFENSKLHRAALLHLGLRMSSVQRILY